jgi:hypothetical protein
VTTHLGTRVAQAGAFLAMVGGVLAVASAPALADQPDVQITNLSSTDLPSGGRTTMNYSVTNTNEVPRIVRVRVTGVDCRGDCTQISQLGPGDTRQFTAQLTAPQVDAGQTRTVQVQVSATVNNDTGRAAQELTVRGADKPKTVRQVVGRVRDSNGKPVRGASVGVRDSQGHSYTTTTNSDGRFQFTSTDQNPILAGTLSVATVKQGFEAVSVSVQGGAGRVLNVPLTLRGGEAPTTAAPTAAETTPAPTDAPTDEAAGPAADATTADAATAANNSGGSGSLMFIILGALLVAAGVGAIVLVLLRRKNPDDDLDDPDAVAVPAGVVPASQGRFHDATRVGAPVGGMGNATMAAGPSLADAPTMLQQPVPAEDEFADPYGAPPPRAYANGYGGPVPTQPAGYDPGPPTQFSSPVPDDDPYAAFGARFGGGGYEPPQRYDEPTGRYRPEPGGYRPDQDYGYRGGSEPGAGSTGSYPPPGDGGYGVPRGRREATGGHASGEYGQDRASGPAGRGSWGPPAGGTDSGNGYGPPAGGRGDYGGGEYRRGAGDYGSSGGYGGPSYGPQGGGYDDPGYGRRPTGGPDSYDRRGGYQGGYRDPEGGYDGDGPGGDRHGGQSGPQPPNPGQQRPLDWLDD